MDLIERDARVLWHPYTQHKVAPPITPIVKGRGPWLETEDGRMIFDGISSWWVNIHGHSHPYLNNALQEQAGRLEQVVFAGCTHEPAIRLAERLIEVLPKGLSRVFYSDNGSTAVEVALKMAFQYWQNRGQRRQRFVALSHAYHGDTFGAMAASEYSSFTAPFSPLLFDVVRARTPYCDERCTVPCASTLDEVLEKYRGEIAAVIAEPIVQGAGGMIMWGPEFLSHIRELCDRYQTLLIADEVLTGFGRTGKMFACEHAGVSPDIICLSKALTAGYLPLGATVATEEIYDAFLNDDRAKTFFHGHSYTANPLACSVGSASLDLFEEDDCPGLVAEIEALFKRRLPQLTELENVVDVRITGAIAAIEIAAATSGYFAEIGQQLAAEFLRRDILLRPLGNVLYLMPPYLATEFELEWVIAEIHDVLERMDGEQGWTP